MGVGAGLFGDRCEQIGEAGEGQERHPSVWMWVVAAIESSPWTLEQSKHPKHFNAKTRYRQRFPADARIKGTSRRTRRDSIAATKVKFRLMSMACPERRLYLCLKCLKPHPTATSNTIDKGACYVMFHSLRFKEGSYVGL